MSFGYGIKQTKVSFDERLVLLLNDLKDKCKRMSSKHLTRFTFRMISEKVRQHFSSNGYHFEVCVDIEVLPLQHTKPNRSIGYPFAWLCYCVNIALHGSWVAFWLTVLMFSSTTLAAIIDSEMMQLTTRYTQTRLQLKLIAFQKGSKSNNDL